MVAETYYVPKEGWAAYQARRRAAHKAKGMCLYCKREAIGGETRCRYHRDYQNQYRYMLKAACLCLWCGKKLMAGDRGRYCVVHAAKRAAHNKRRRQENQARPSVTP